MGPKFLLGLVVVFLTIRGSSALSLLMLNTIDAVFAPNKSAFRKSTHSAIWSEGQPFPSARKPEAIGSIPLLTQIPVDSFSFGVSGVCCGGAEILKADFPSDKRVGKGAT